MGARGLAWGVAAHPAVRFLVLGGLLFGAHHLWGTPREGAAVSLAQAPRQSLFEAFELEHGRPPDGRERRALLEQWAQDEALVRHAYALRLHETDSVVRRRLIQDVEFLLEAEAQPPTEQALRARYLAERERFVSPALRSFDHVFVAAGQPGAQGRAEALRSRLMAGAEPTALGDPSSLGVHVRGYSRERLAQRLDQALAARAFELEQGGWSEPLRSPLGFHLLRMTEQRPARPRPFEEVEAQLRDELTEQARERALARGRAELRARYVEGEP